MDKTIGTITALIFMISAWYIYAIYPFTMNMVFAIVATVFILGSIVKNYFFSKEEITEKENGYDIARILFSFLGFLGFITFFVMVTKLGGSSAEDSYASWRYEDYEVGQYYLSSHGRFTLVNYQTWIRMKVFEQIVMPVFILTSIWNFLYLARTKGIRFLFTGKGDAVGFTFSTSTTLEKLGFIFLFIFIFSISISIMFALFL